MARQRDTWLPSSRSSGGSRDHGHPTHFRRHLPAAETPNEAAGFHVRRVFSKASHMTTCMLAMGGGGGAFMVSFFSSVDPIFYLHHCNLDRVAGCGRPALPQGAGVAAWSKNHSCSSATKGANLSRRARQATTRRSEFSTRIHLLAGARTRYPRQRPLSRSPRPGYSPARSYLPDLTRIALWLASNASPRETANGPRGQHVLIKKTPCILDGLECRIGPTPKRDLRSDSLGRDATLG
jgi:Common central domain of tyrosinase